MFEVMNMILQDGIVLVLNILWVRYLVSIGVIIVLMLMFMQKMVKFELWCLFFRLYSLLIMVEMLGLNRLFLMMIVVRLSLKMCFCGSEIMNRLVVMMIVLVRIECWQFSIWLVMQLLKIVVVYIRVRQVLQMWLVLFLLVVLLLQNWVMMYSIKVQWMLQNVKCFQNLVMNSIYNGCGWFSVVLKFGSVGFGVFVVVFMFMWIFWFGG